MLSLPRRALSVKEEVKIVVQSEIQRNEDEEEYNEDKYASLAYEEIKTRYYRYNSTKLTKEFE